MSTQDSPAGRSTTNRVPTDDEHTDLQDSRSPFCRLPDDIIREIFIACIDPTWNPAMSWREAPVLLTRISSATRCFALHTPALWAAIHISILRTTKQSSPEQKAANEAITVARARGVEEWLLRRSSSMLLRISVEEPCDHTPPNCFGTNPLSDKFIWIVQRCSTRWQDVSFAMSLRSQGHLTLMTPAEVPLLRSIELYRSPDHGHLKSGSWTISTLLRAPILKRLTLSYIVDPRNSCQFMVNWGNLTYLKLDNILKGDPTSTSHNIEISSTDTLRVPSPSTLDHTLRSAAQHLTHATAVPSALSIHRHVLDAAIRAPALVRHCGALYPPDLRATTVLHTASASISA